MPRDIVPSSLEDPGPNRESLESIREIQELIASGHPGYATIDEMFDALDAQTLSRLEPDVEVGGGGDAGDFAFVGVLPDGEVEID